MLQQAKAPESVPMTEEAFAPNDRTDVYWLTSDCFLINSHGTTILIDPSLSSSYSDPYQSEVMDDAGEEYLRLLVKPPIYASDIKELSAILITHSDPDHMGPDSIRALATNTTAKFHGTPYTCQELQKLGVPAERTVIHNRGEFFNIDDVRVEVTEAFHPWQVQWPEIVEHVFQKEDVCGFKFYTRDAKIWHPGDSCLLQSHFKTIEDCDLVLMDFSDDKPNFHFGMQEAADLVNSNPKCDIIMCHWGTFYSPDVPSYACDPEVVKPLIENVERFHVVTPGVKFVATRK